MFKLRELVQPEHASEAMLAVARLAVHVPEAGAVCTGTYTHAHMLRHDVENKWRECLETSTQEGRRVSDSKERYRDGHPAVIRPRGGRSELCVCVCLCVCVYVREGRKEKREREKGREMMGKVIKR